MVAEAFAFHRGIHDGELLQRDNSRADKKRHESEACAIALFKARFELIAKIDDTSDVHFKHAVNVGAGPA